ncbi:hypothetical protein L596_021374 [Steinernema carpocapsae]|uniref:SHSP domain-containing protein n=1 Tax=Steinernema carpocapsae TaxID=34508 RepID=A0A4U5MIJ1_STECR|nr:hypothetical protein L596_021374 [Steinernema carpocapsae]
MSRRPLTSSGFGAPFSPFFNTHNRFFDEFDFDRPFRRPYWAEHNMLNGHRIGDGVGEVISEGDSFSVSVDVSHFKPEELKVNVCDNQLIIEGKHEEKNDEFGMFFGRAPLRPQIQSSQEREGRACHQRALQGRNPDRAVAEEGS